MKRSTIVILTALLLTAAAPKLTAYELPVHAHMTNEAYKRSILVDAEFLNRLGIENGADP